MIRREDQKGDTVTFNHTMSGFGFSTGTLAYAVKGNQTSRPATLSVPALNLDWNFDNQLRGADTNGSAGSLEVTFEYDALGRRVSRSHSSGNVVYVHAGQQVIADYARGAVTSSPTYRYVYADCLGYAGYVDEPILRHTGTTTTLPTTGDNALYYHRNQQYSIVGLTNAAGTLVERYTYSAYGTLGIYAANGSVRSSSTYANRYTYTGREWDGDLRLYHFRTRWYDPATGGFISRDPLGYVDGMSLYRSYKGLRASDPTGTRNSDLTCTCKRDSFGLSTVDVSVTCPCPSDEARCCKAVCDAYPSLYGWNGSWRGARCNASWTTKDGCIQSCQDQCAYDAPSWYHYHFYVACVNGCLTGCNGNDFDLCGYIRYSMTEADRDSWQCLCGLVDIVDVTAPPNAWLAGFDCTCAAITTAMNYCATNSQWTAYAYGFLSSIDCGLDVWQVFRGESPILERIDFAVLIFEQGVLLGDPDNDFVPYSCYKLRNNWSDCSVWRIWQGILF